MCRPHSFESALPNQHVRRSNPLFRNGHAHVSPASSPEPPINASQPVVTRRKSRSFVGPYPGSAREPDAFDLYIQSHSTGWNESSLSSSLRSIRLSASPSECGSDTEEDDSAPILRADSADSAQILRELNRDSLNDDDMLVVLAFFGP